MQPSEATTAALALLDQVVAATGGTPRDGQREFTAATAAALEHGTHLVAQAPTGTGKTYAFGAAVATWLAARDRPDRDDDPRDDGDDTPPRPRVVITTATKALQDQLAGKDLPAVCGTLAAQGGPDLTFAVVKGRGAYACLAKMAAITEDHQAGLFGSSGVEEVITWARDSATGDRDEHPRAIIDRDWAEVSASAGECPGATRCDHGAECFAEAAKRRAESADVVVVNTHLYVSHLLAEEKVLPAHQAVVIDEAHSLADTVVSCAQVTIAPGRIRRAVKAAASAGAAPTQLDQIADRLHLALRDAEPGRITDLPAHPLAAILVDLGTAVAGTVGELTPPDPATRDRAERALSLLESLADDLLLLAGADDRSVCWIDEQGGSIAAAPVSAARLASSLLWPARTVIACSATLGVGRDRRTGAPDFTPFLAGLGAGPGGAGDGHVKGEPAAPEIATLAVASPFDFRAQGLLLVPAEVPADWRDPGFAPAVHDAMERLVRAADGRMLSLFTSKRATTIAADELRERLASTGIEVATQWDAPQSVLLERLRQERRLLLCATQGWFQGIDVAGDALVVVTIDKLPFPRPDDPQWEARREEVGGFPASFARVDVPRAATLLAQALGRLIRTTSDRGVAVVFDGRLADRSKPYQRTIVDTLPAFRRSRSLDDALALLAEA